MYHSRIASWVPPSNGSTPMVQLFHRLAQIDLVASFLEKQDDAVIDNEFMPEMFGISVGHPSSLKGWVYTRQC